MATSRAQEGVYAPFIILIALLVGIVAYVIVTTPAEREALIGPIYSERAALDISPGLVKGMPAKSYGLEHELPSIELDCTPISKENLLSSRVLVECSGFSNKQAQYVISVNKSDFAGASLSFNVVSRTGNKELLVYLDDVLIFAGVLGAGPQEVPLPIDSLKEHNTIKISVAPPGPAFWQKTTYILSDIKLLTKNYFEERSGQSATFDLSTTELNGLLGAHFDCYAKQLSPNPGKIKIALNGETLWFANPPTSGSISFEIPPTMLNQTNTLEFSTERDSHYQILFGKITTSYVKAAYKIPTWKFNLTNEELAYAKSGKANCWLIVRASEPLTQPITFLINYQKVSFTPKDGAIEADICAYLQKENQLSIYPPTDLYLTSLKVVYKRKV